MYLVEGRRAGEKLLDSLGIHVHLPREDLAKPLGEGRDERG